jgi:hypothetical protein
MTPQRRQRQRSAINRVYLPERRRQPRSETEGDDTRHRSAARVAREFDLGLFISEASPRNFAIALSLQLGRTIMRCREPVYPHMTESGVS